MQAYAVQFLFAWTKRYSVFVIFDADKHSVYFLITLVSHGNKIWLYLFYNVLVVSTSKNMYLSLRTTQWNHQYKRNAQFYTYGSKYNFGSEEVSDNAYYKGMT